MDTPVFDALELEQIALLANVSQVDVLRYAEGNLALFGTSFLLWVEQFSYEDIARDVGLWLEVFDGL